MPKLTKLDLENIVNRLEKENEDLLALVTKAQTAAGNAVKALEILKQENKSLLDQVRTTEITVVLVTVAKKIAAVLKEYGITSIAEGEPSDGEETDR